MDIAGLVRHRHQGHTSSPAEVALDVHGYSVLLEEPLYDRPARLVGAIFADGGHYDRLLLQVVADATLRLRGGRCLLREADCCQVRLALRVVFQRVGILPAKLLVLAAFPACLSDHLLLGSCQFLDDHTQLCLLPRLRAQNPDHGLHNLHFTHTVRLLALLAIIASTAQLPAALLAALLLASQPCADLLFVTWLLAALFLVSKLLAANASFLTTGAFLPTSRAVVRFIASAVLLSQTLW
mmetsp:Transcript_107200/g.228932  ORF Transcript_107200/g.228932 Transcript_107200/m.228932 type:complete len:239 (-) Transcript_107200:247-963(-)